MSKILFKGQNAGLGKAASGGDASSVFDYEITCGCGKLLGVLGGFRANEAGTRTLFCPICQHVTLVDKNAQITNYVPFNTLKNG
jgi:hypothetical protein